jgi:glycosyltransferase involved in cell wall biosynthesis
MTFNFSKGLVSIIIPIFNREKLLHDTLKSIILQSYTNWECLVVDDESTDNTFEVAFRYSLVDSRIKVFKRPRLLVKGANSCRNYGYQISSGEFIHWFDSDDIMDVFMLEKKINSLINCNSDILVCRASFFMNNIKEGFLEIYSPIKPTTDNPAFELILSKISIQTSQILFRRDIFKNLNPIFNEKLQRNQETELLIKLFLHDFKFIFLNESLVYIRKHSNSITENYSNLSLNDKITLDIDAYISMYFEFKKRNKLTKEVDNFFQLYFIKCLKKMNYKSIKYFNLFFFGNFYSIFPSLYFSIRILFYKVVKNV